MQIDWSGFKWNVRTGSGGPGPNNWSDSANNVFVDSQNRLHLKITNSAGKWYCAEIYTTTIAEQGEYKFQVSSNPANLTYNVVGGLFYYLDDQDEIDIEFSRWGDPNANNTQYTVWAITGGIESPRGETNIGSTTHLFRWNPSQIYFESVGILSWNYTGPNFPKTGGELHLNLWLIDGKPPADSKEQELILSNFTYNKETPKKYKCTGAPDYQCTEDPNGPYNSLQECQNACKPTPQTKKFKVQTVGLPTKPSGILVMKNTMGDYTSYEACKLTCDTLKNMDQ